MGEIPVTVVVDRLVDAILAQMTLARHADDIELGNVTCSCLSAGIKSLRQPDPREYFLANACDVVKQANKTIDLARDAVFGYNGREF